LDVKKKFDPTINNEKLIYEIIITIENGCPDESFTSVIWEGFKSVLKV